MAEDKAMHTFGPETFIDLNKKLAHLSNRVALLERIFKNMTAKAIQLETLTEAVKKNAEKEKEMTNIVDLMLANGQDSLNIVKYVLGFLHHIRRKCNENLPVMKTIADMHQASKTLEFKEHVLKVMPELGLAVGDLSTLLSVLDFFNQSKILTSGIGVFIKSQVTLESPPLAPLTSEGAITKTGLEVRELLKLITNKKLDKKTRISLRRFIAVGQCSRTNRPLKEFPDLFLVKEILGLR